MENGVNPDSGNSNLSLDQGAHELTSILSGISPEEKKEAAPEREAREPEQANEADATDQVSEEETSEDNSEQDATSQSEEDAASEDDEPKEPSKIRLADGTEVTLEDVEEWRRGNLRDADYRRKTMELADTRKALETRQAEIAQKSQQFEQTIDFAIGLAQANLPAKPDRAAYGDDLIGFIQHKAEYDDRVEQLQQLFAAKQQHEQEITTQRQQAFKEWTNGERDRLAQALPELRDPAKLNQFNADLVKGIERYGFSRDDLGKVYDHRLILLAKDAMAYQKLMANRPKAQEKAKGAAPVQQPGRRTSPAEQRARGSKDKWDRLRRDGSMESGAAVLLDLVKGT